MKRVTRLKRLSRRTILRGAGAAVALPFLEAMRPRRARADEPDPLDPGPPPRRFVGLFMPNGMHMPDWTPTSTGPDYELSPILSPLAPFKSDLLVLSGLSNLAAKVPTAGDHARGTGSFLTCMEVFKSEADIQNGISLDQRLAQQLGQWTSFPSIELGAEGGSGIGDCDSGYSCAYSRNISWANATTPMPKEVNPLEAFDRMFASFDQTLTAAQVARRRLLRLSVLDFVTTDTKALKQQLGQSDRIKLEQYLDGVRELEKRIEKEAEAPACYPGAKPKPALDVVTHVELMMDIVALAFQCDQTRVMTFMLGNGGSNRVHAHLGISDEHHYLSHHAGEAAKQAALSTIGTWEVGIMTYLMTKLAAIEEADGTVLDNSLVFLSSEIEDGNTHWHTNLPVLLGGRAGGAITPGRHLSYEDDEPLANLYVSILNALGVNDQTFGTDGTKPLAGIDS